MKKLFLLLTMVAMLATACTGGGVDENDKPQNPTEQPNGGNDDGGGSGNDDNTGNDDEKPTGGPISVSKGRVNFDFEGGECELMVDAEYSWVATCSVDWITLQTPDGIADEEPLKFTVKRNTSLSERKATITLKNENYNLMQEVYVIQSEFAPVIEVVESVSLDFTACEEFVEVTSNVEYDVTDDADWLTCEVVEGGINLSVSANGTLETRLAQVTISAKENPEALSINISVIQAPPESQYTIFYTSTDGEKVYPNLNVFGAKIIGHGYTDNQGVLMFDGPITSIGEGAFKNRTSLKSVTIPDSVTSIGDDAFALCTSLTSITIGNGVTSIGKGAFYYCSGELIINSKIVETNYTSTNYPSNNSNGWFYGSEFTKLTIGDSATKIGRYAFYGCYSLSKVNCKPTTPPMGANYMFDYSSSVHIYVPRNSVSAYNSAYYWSVYNIIGYDFN